jgi:hypothetical protein
MSGKGRIAIVLAVAACMLIFLAALALAQPTDIQGHWAEKTVSSWVYNGYIAGYPDGTFQPDNTITRAEFAVLANKSFGNTNTAVINFKDVKATDWFYGEIGKAMAGFYITGYEDGTFRPEAQVSRQEAAVMVARLLNLGAAASTTTFSDAAAFPAWSSGHIGAVVAKGVMSGYPDGTFQPNKALSRAEAVVLLNGALAARAAAVPVPAPVLPGDVADLLLPDMIEGVVTVNNTDYPMDIADNKGTVDLSGLSPDAVLVEVRIFVDISATLVMDDPAGMASGTELPVSQELAEGWNTLDTFANLVALYPVGGLTLEEMETVFAMGKDITIKGTLTTDDGTNNISLMFILPE